MSERKPIKIQVAPQNPVQYLACCGIFEIVSRFDATATSRWITHPHPEFAMESLIDEGSILSCLVRTFTDSTCWNRSPTDSEAVNRLNVSLALNGEYRALCLDWWYETLDWEGSIKQKSAWKMYAGQQTADGIIQDMVRIAKEIADTAQLKTVANLIEQSKGMTGRFGIDPRSSRNALDAGFSANDLKLSIPTYPFAELLAIIGAQHFFPHRTRQRGGNESTRGWVERTIFQYGLWTIPLTIALARVAASCAAFDDETSIIPMRSLRASRDKYSNLTMASQATLRRQKK